MKSERRAAYRVAPDNRDRLELVLCSEPGNPTAHEIVDITIDGAGTRFPKEGTPRLAIGDKVKLCFTSPNFAQDVEVEATVAARTEFPEHRHYSFRFDGQAGGKRELPEEFYRVFNRRGAYRAAAFDTAPAVEVDINALGTTPRKVTARARLKNISATGLGALVDAESDRDLAGVSSVEISARLPDSSRALRIVAWIRNRESQNGQVYYGFMFDAKQTEDYLDQEEEIVDYVLCRYQEKLADTRQ